MFGLILGLGIALVAGLAVLIIVLAVKQKPENSEVTDGGSYFDGNTLQLIGYNILSNIITTLTLGIAYPWAACMLERWKVKHTVINGRRLKFTGHGIQLFGKYILWWFLTVITCGIYSIWLGVNMEKWKTKHTVYADGKYDTTSEFTAGAGGWFVNHFIFYLLNFVTLGIAYPWSEVRLMKWKAEHRVIGGSPLVFTGKGGTLFVKNLLCVLLTPITLGIYLLVYPVVLLKWEFKNTLALYRTEPLRKLSRAHEENANKDYAKIRLAANDSELAAVKSGFTGKETPEELKNLADEENPFACYALALHIKGEAPAFEGEALELLKNASDSGYHAAMQDYSSYIEDAEQRCALLEESVKKGNAKAPWQLKGIYEEKANSSKDGAKLESLTTTAYWFKVALELEDGEAVAHQTEYAELLEILAILHCKNHPASKSSGAVVVGIAVGAVALIAVIGLGVAWIFGYNMSSEVDTVHTDSLVISNSSWVQLPSDADEAQIRDILRSCSVDYEIVYISNGDAEPGHLVQVTVNSVGVDETGFYVEQGDKFVIYIKQDTSVSVSYVGGMDEEKAIAILQDEGFNVDVQYEETGDVEAGTVISQSEHDIELERGSTIIIYVAKEPASDYKYDIGTVINNPSEADFQLFYDMVKTNIDLWTDDYSVFSFTAADANVHTLIEPFLFQSYCENLFNAYGFNFHKEELQLDPNDEMSMHCRYKAEDVEWVLKAVFDREVERYGKSSQRNTYFDGDYFYRAAHEYYMGAGYTDVLTLNTSHTANGDGSYTIKLDGTTKWEYDDEINSFSFQFVAVPMNSRDLGTYWRIVSFTK